MTRLIKMPHWQLFLIFFVLPILGGIIGGVAFLSSFISDLMVFEETGAAPDFEGVFSFMYFALGFSLIIHVLYQIWQFSIGQFLYKTVADKSLLAYKRFVVANIFIGIYYILIGILGFMVTTDIIQAINNPNFVDETDLFSAQTAQYLLIMAPFHLLALIAFVNNWLFLGKALKLAEQKAADSVGDYIVEAILFWIWPIGVWLFQPRLQQLEATAEL